MTVTIAPVVYSTAPGQKPRVVEPLEFRSYGALLRHIAATGDDGMGRSGPRSPRDFFLGSRDRRTRKPCGYSLHVARRWLRDHQVSEADLDALMRLQERYRAYVHHCTEVMPQWRETSRIPYMDNSEEAVQTNKWGGTRRVMVTAPHGDLCY